MTLVHSGVMLVTATESPKPVKRGRIKRVVGLIAIALVVVFTILSIRGILSFAEWIILEIIVALIANIIFRTVDERSKQ
jgi:hypothetical protein